MERIVIIYGIAYHCPHVNRVKSCPFMEIESLSFKSKLDWLKLQTEKRMLSILDQHLKCSRRRESKESFYINRDHSPENSFYFCARLEGD